MKHLNCRIILSLTILIALIAAARLIPAQSSDAREFHGTINNTLRIRMTLSRSGKVVSGSYVYERIGKSLRLNGEMTSEEEFYLNEFDERGNQTGKFEGKFVSKDWIEGTWSSTTAKKQMPFSAWVVDGQQVPTTNANDRVGGKYQRVDKSGKLDRNSSELNVWLLRDGSVRIKGDSTWVGNVRTGNVNVGDVDGIFPLQGNKLSVKSGEEAEACRFTITFGVDSLIVSGDNLQCGGLNVSFDGKYRKTGPARSE